MSSVEQVGGFLGTVKTAAIVSFGAVATGASKSLEIIHGNIGELTSASGFILAMVLIYFHFRKGRLELRKLQLELQMLQRKEQADYNQSVDQEASASE